MIYLSGCATPEVRAGDRRDVGIIANPESAVDQHADRVAAWSIDNGAFGQWVRGETFRFDAWWRWVRTRDFDAGRLLFVVCPDVPADQRQTNKLAEEWTPRLRQLGVPVAIAAQNGYTADNYPWHLADAMFIGGDTPWKLSAEAMGASFDAKRRGLWSHMGRVNSERRMRWAEECGCDSVDGTFLAYAPRENWRRLTGFLDAVDTRPALPMAV